MRAGAYVKERSERRWRRRGRAVKSQGGGAVAQWRGDASDEAATRCAQQLTTRSGLCLVRLLQRCPDKLALWAEGGDNGPTTSSIHVSVLPSLSSRCRLLSAHTAHLRVLMFCHDDECWLCEPLVGLQ
eukprot:scaffold7547_cov61-Phaeocystis_antarctica.AAC.2